METNVFVYAIFRDEKRGARAVRGLLDAAFSARDINALLSGTYPGGSYRSRELTPAHHTGIQRGAMLGAALGLGGGALVASGGILIAGPLFLGLQGTALAGGAFGSLLGTLAGLAHWNDEIEFPANSFARGGALIGVATHEGRAGLALEILVAAGGRRARVSTKREAKQVVRDRASSASSALPSQKAAH